MSVWSLGVNTTELHVLWYFFPHSQRTNLHSLALVLTVWKKRERECVCVYKRLQLAFNASSPHFCRRHTFSFLYFISFLIFFFPFYLMSSFINTLSLLYFTWTFMAFGKTLNLIKFIYPIRTTEQLTVKGTQCARMVHSGPSSEPQQLKPKHCKFT